MNEQDEKCFYCGKYSSVIMLSDSKHPICAKCANAAPVLVGMDKKAKELGKLILSVLAPNPKP